MRILFSMRWLPLLLTVGCAAPQQAAITSYVARAPVEASPLETTNVIRWAGASSVMIGALGLVFSTGLMLTSSDDHLTEEVAVGFSSFGLMTLGAVLLAWMSELSNLDPGAHGRGPQHQPIAEQ